ncbi:hypothetical protein OIU77_003069 [Salix suchowensis]|uniref:Aminotransferase class I/classII large domain-containing protein n=1 Tax=Salix suchowensis TaxID=1278906 RepID=A0ABQ9AZL6_9ROSI|nr:hypothetical protein OIU77_003069 [Salix suchowensis]
MGTNVLKTETPTSIDDAVYFLKENLNEGDHRPSISFGFGDPSCFECFRTTPVAEEAIVEAVRSAKFNSYAPTGGILPARRAVADYLSRDLPYRLSPDDVYLTLGCNQAAEITIEVLARPGANILLPRPGYPDIEAYAIFNKLEIRQFDLLPERGWEVDLDTIEAMSDESTVAMVIINPGNPSGSVYTYNHLNKIAETARKLGIVVIADEVYGHLVYGSNPFVPMMTCDPSGLLRKDEIAESINKLLVYSPFPPTLIQGAIPQILEKTTQDFFSKTINILRKNLEICYDKLKEIPCMMIPQKPEGAFFAMILKMTWSFCLKLAKEESLIILPGVTVGLKNWLCMTFAVEYSSLEDGLGRRVSTAEDTTITSPRNFNSISVALSSWSQQVFDTYKHDPLLQKVITRKMVNTHSRPEFGLVDGLLGYKGIIAIGAEGNLRKKLVSVAYESHIEGKQGTL